jgi:Protein of unknown function (DUF2510)
MALPAPPYQTPAWYPDPEGSGRNRWWNGVAWTEDFQVSAATPQPAAASGAAEKLAEAQSLISSMPEFAGKPLPTLAAARLARTRVVSYVLGLGLAAAIFAIANLGAPPVFGWLAVVVGLAAYGLALLAVRLRFLRPVTNRVLAALGTVLASVAICFVILTAILGWHLDFSASGGGQSVPVPVPVTTPAQVPPSTSPDQQVRDREATLLIQISNEWLSTFQKTGLWPASASINDANIVVFPGGTTDVSIPAGYTLRYLPSADRKTFILSLTDPSGVGLRYTQANSQLVRF